MRRARRGAGFSLIELMSALAIVAVLFAIGLPDLRQLVRRQQYMTAVDDLFGALRLARGQAIARGARVELVPAGADWSRGWIVFIDNDGDRSPGSGDEVIAAHGPLADGIVVSSNFSGQQGKAYFAYNGAGRGCTDTSGAAARWGTLSLFRDGQVRRIKINMLGRARVCDPARDGASCPGEGEPP